MAVPLTRRRRGLNWAGEVYHWAIALVCLTALVMVPYDWSRLWYFWPITIASYLFVYLGQRSAEAPGGLWYRGVLRGDGGGGTAQAGGDYAATSGHLTFAPGETSKPVTVDLANDAAHEDTERFALRLSN